MKTCIDTNFLTSWTWKVSQGQVHGQTSHQKGSGDENMQMLHSTVTQLHKVMPKKDENGL